MTSTSPALRRARAIAPEPSGLNWEKLGIVAAIAVNLIAGAAAFATVRADVANLRAEIPPGSIARLDERTDQIQKSIDRLATREEKR